jgi:hypothetical protein
MNSNSYLRAYLAGVFIPTLIFPLAVAALLLGKLALHQSFPVERIVIFPLAFVPFLWGFWNVLWVASRKCTHLPLGLHGAILPFLLMPAGAALARCLGVVSFGPSSVTWFQMLSIPYALIACGFVFALAAYYLVWKYIVGSVNRDLGIA